MKSRTTRAAKAAASTASAPAIDPEAFYIVTASERFEHRRIPFGTIAAAEVRGSILTEVLAGEHAAKVANYVPAPVDF